MKTMNFKVALMMAAVIGSTAFVSCSSDDEESPKGGGTTSKRIVKMTWSDGDEIDITTFDYDSQGRVVKEIVTDIYGSSEHTYTTTYAYVENTIISKTGDWNDGETYTYTLSDGLIIKEVENYKNGSYSSTDTYNYTYDSNGYLKTYISEDDKTEFTWTDGNLTKYTEVWDDGYSTGYSTTTVSYSDILWPKNWMHYWKGTNINQVLEPLGAWGKMPKYLPKKFVRVYDGTSREWTLDYTIENGEIVKVIYQSIEDGEISTEITTIEWE